MSFIAHGKTNLKYLFIVAIVAAIAGGGIWLLQMVAQKEMVKLEELPGVAESTSGESETTRFLLRSDLNRFIDYNA